MRELFANSLNLEAGQVVSGVARQKRNLRIASGRVWITVEGELCDYWLGAGDTFTVPTGRLLVIEADHQASRVDFISSRKPSAAGGLLTQLSQLAQRLLASKPGAAPCASR
ncbi:DUF2917 domain-containing protein [Janthinobacterium fluminis]|uniref:DUF2917 domain-containing protein n=1 Tax=Janthinobacterium fluminis TaxID=2987524 RepID=A0ABT5K727_9BURK|nr:DUF2917 domain-containing protein [Janthinobacterium fluminis]MDC8760240.1 DUF2917 domain-containing protein [Janthinobacterium fluminis]